MHQQKGAKRRIYGDIALLIRTIAANPRATMNRYVISRLVPRGVLTAVIAAFLMTSFSAKAVNMQLANYNFTGQSLASGSNGASHTSTNISGGITGNAQFSTGSEGLYLNFPANFIGSSQADSFANGKYVSFTITPTNGIQIAPETLFYRVFVDNQSGTAATGTVEFRWSINSFSVPLGSRSVGADANQFATGTAQHFFSATTTGPVEFRVYFYATSNTSNLSVGFDTLVVRGDVSPIPEPGSLGLLLLGGWMLALRSPARMMARARS